MHPVLFQIGDFVIGTYGLMIAIGLLAGLGLSARLARRRELAPEFVFDLAFVLLAGGKGIGGHGRSPRPVMFLR